MYTPNVLVCLYMYIYFSHSDGLRQRKGKNESQSHTETPMDETEQVIYAPLVFLAITNYFKFLLGEAIYCEVNKSLPS